MDLLQEDTSKIEYKDIKNLIRTHELIQSVKRRPELWNRNLKIYSIVNRMKVWTEICGELVPQFASLNKVSKYEIVQNITKKWYNVRDSYKKTIRCKRAKPYIYADSLSFLDSVFWQRKDFYRDEDSINYNFDDKSDEESFVEEYFESEDNDATNKNSPKVKTEEVYLEADDVDVSPAKVLKIMHSNENDTKTEETQINSFFQDESLIPMLTDILEREKDEDRLFFNSLIPTVKTLKYAEKLEFRIQILTLLKSLTVKKESEPI